jgi:hypothetical protein
VSEFTDQVSASDLRGNVNQFQSTDGISIGERRSSIEEQFFNGNTPASVKDGIYLFW